MEMESTEVVLFVLMLYSFVTELLQPEPEPTRPSTQIRSRHPSNAIIAKLVQNQRRLKSLKKRFGRRKARSMAMFHRRMADDDERFHGLRTAMICEYYGTRRVPRSLWVNNRTSAWWEKVVPTYTDRLLLSLLELYCYEIKKQEETAIMFGYGRKNFTWNGTLKELEGSYPERGRAAMTAPLSSSSGWRSSSPPCRDVESTLNILNVLDELLSAGTDRRIHYMISKGGSEALLSALVTTARSFNRRIGMKADEAGAVLLTLNLLRKNVQHANRAAACLWVIQVFCSSVSTANLIGENQGLDVIYRLIPHYATKNQHTIKAAIDAFAALLCTKANVCWVVSKGYIFGLLQLYEDWHSNGAQHDAIPIRHSLLRCLHKTCLLSKGLESLVEPSLQLMRKCLPTTPLPLTSDQSAYTFPLPGRAHTVPDIEPEADMRSEASDDDDDDDDDLETDLNKLRFRPDPDRPKELLPHSEPEEGSTASSSSSDDEAVLLNTSSFGSSRRDRRRSSASWDWSTSSSGSHSETEPDTAAASHLEVCDFHSDSSILSTSPSFRTMGKSPSRSERDELDDEEDAEESHHGTMIETLLERHGVCIPHHEPRLYRAAAAKTKSIPGFSILAFPDFWGHLPPPGHEPMAPRKPNVQRQKVFEDVQRFLNPDDIIDQVVFDLEDSSLQCPSDSLRFYSKFECGNLRKAVQVRRYEYDLILNADANCNQHMQWFYFEVSNMVPGTPYRFNVINCEKSNSQFNYGMQPVLYSVREALEGRPHWVRSGTEICYYRNHYCPARGRRRTTFYTLTFTITFKHSEDVCYLAYHYPYTYSALKANLKLLQRSVDPTKVIAPASC
ncbi:hypothetical protein F7725_022211 [Dissostichus mawsoni]|uniref:Cytosolic carboxypeptidase N-terminal domain-containing protein n=1 Tax=Dissostichus mawsoni TaxID=36200 RepID=A0A7J5YXK3_DISMA|nr:hypothetical protein F7725_022211 [Dissostichus mawsoni]